MAWSYIGKGTGIAANNAASLSVPHPGAGETTNDLLVIIAYSRNGAVRTPDLPAGWSEAARYDGGSTRGEIAVFYRLHPGGSPGDVTVAFSGAGATGVSEMAQMAAFSGNLTSGPLGDVGADSNWAAAQNIGPVTAVTLTTADQLLLVIAGRQQDMGTNGISNVVSTLSGDSQTWVEIEERGTTLGTDAGYVWDYAFTSGTPTITNKTFTNSNTQTAAGCGMMVAFKVASVVNLTNAGNIASAEVIGSPAVSITVSAVSIASAEALGQPGLSVNLTTSGIAGAEAFGSPGLNANLTVSGIAGAEAFGSPGITPILSATGIATVAALGQPDISANLTTLGIDGSEAFGSPTVSTDAFISNAGNIAGAEALGQADVSLSLSTSGLATAEAMGQPALAADILVLHPRRLLEDGYFRLLEDGGFRLLEGVSLGGIESAEAYGVPDLSLGISVAGVVSAEAFGMGSLWAEVSVAGLPSEETFGTPTVSTNVFLTDVGGIASAEAIGTAELAILVEPAGVLSEELFGTPAVSVAYSVSPYGIGSEEAFGTATVAIQYFIRQRAKDKAGKGIEDVTAVLFDATTYTVAAQGVTDSEGWVSLPAPDNTNSHFMLFFKDGLAAVSKRTLVGT